MVSIATQSARAAFGLRLISQHCEGVGDDGVDAVNDRLVSLRLIRVHSLYEAHDPHGDRLAPNFVGRLLVERLPIAQPRAKLGGERVRSDCQLSKA